MTDHPEPPDPNRRSVLRWAIHGLGALFTVILGFPIAMYVIDPRNRKAKPADFRAVDGIRLTELTESSPPRQGVIRDVRRDAWTLHPDDVIGRVWVVKTGPLKDDLRVMSTVCPHLGCSINLNTDGARAVGFRCPCHNGRFFLDGKKNEEGGLTNPAPRRMDDLEFRVDAANEDRLLVKFKSFKTGEAKQIEIT